MRIIIELLAIMGVVAFRPPDSRRIARLKRILLLALPAYASIQIPIKSISWNHHGQSERQKAR